MSEKGKAKKPIFKKLLLLCAVLAVVCALALTSFTVAYPRYHYALAEELLTAENYADAFRHLAACRGFKDAPEKFSSLNLFYRKTTNYNYGDNGKLHTKTISEFDERGNLLTATVFDAFGKVLSRRTNQYNENGDLLLGELVTQEGLAEKTEKSYNEQGKLLLESYVNLQTTDADFKVVYEYDGEGREVLITHYDGKEQTTAKYEFKYSNSGYTATLQNFDKQGNPADLFVQTYDQKGNMIKVEIFDKNGELLSTEERSYDENGNLLCRFYPVKNGSLPVKTLYTYDKMGNEISCAQYDDDGNVTGLAEYTYYTNGTKKSATEVDEFGNKATLKFDREGNEILSVYYNAEEGVTTREKLHYDYEYDEKGFLVKATFYNLDGEIAHVCEYESPTVTPKVK